MEKYRNHTQMLISDEGFRAELNNLMIPGRIVKICLNSYSPETPYPYIYVKTTMTVEEICNEIGSTSKICLSLRGEASEDYSGKNPIGKIEICYRKTEFGIFRYIVRDC